MDMTLRWFGEGIDSVSLEQIRQIPGVKGVITTLYDIPAGEEWPMERILQMKEQVEAKGLKVMGIESVNIHDAIKVGTPDREKYIANYITTLERLGQADIHVVCYNFMPVFDWTRSDLAKVRPDGSTVLAYDQKEIDKINPENMFESMGEKSNGFELPGWEPERMARIKELFEMYKDVDEEKLFNNLVYFLKAIQPVCEKYDIRMAIHPDDPAWPVFGLSRIITDKEHLLKLMKAVDAPFNGVTLCTGSLGSNPENDIPDIIRSLKGRLDNLTVGLCGDLKFGRTVHSLINALVRYTGIRFVLISPPELRIPDYIREDVLQAKGIEYREVENLDEAMPELDILYMTRVQKERFFNEEDYIRMKDCYILDKQKMSLAREDMFVLHPLPRVNEISVEVDDDPRAAYFRQVQYGVYVRMALIMTLLEVEKPC